MVSKKETIPPTLTVEFFYYVPILNDHVVNLFPMIIFLAYTFYALCWLYTVLLPFVIEY